MSDEQKAVQDTGLDVAVERFGEVVNDAQNGIFHRDDGKVEMKAADRCYSVAALRHKALAAQEAWKTLAKSCKDLAEMLDEYEGEAVAATRQERLLFKDAEQADSGYARKTIGRMALACAVAAQIVRVYECHWPQAEGLVLALLGEFHKMRQPSEHETTEAK